VGFFVQPPHGGGEATVALLARGFRRSQAGVAPGATVRVSLTPSEDELRAALPRRLRTWTRQWSRRGVHIRVGGGEDIPTLARLAEATARHQGFSALSEGYLDTLYRRFGPSGQAVLLIAELEGSPVAAELFTGCGGLLKSRVTGMERTRRDVAKLNVPSALIWYALRWAKEHGYHAFDFGGVRPQTARALSGAEGSVRQDQIADPDVFKTKFGGRLCVYPPAVELINSRVVRVGYDLLRGSERGTRVLGALRAALRGGG
jgi:hypothetical protein